MNVVLWIIAGLLALVFLGAGFTHLLRSRDQLAASGMGWAQDLSVGMVKTIGALEVLAAIGLILPAVLDIAAVLVPLSALGLVIVMAGAAVTHTRRKEMPAVIFNIVLLVLAAVVAWGRFGPYSFTS